MIEAPFRWDDVPSGPRANVRQQTDKHLGQVAEGGCHGLAGRFQAGPRLGPERKQRGEWYFHVSSTDGDRVKN